MESITTSCFQMEDDILATITTDYYRPDNTHSHDDDRMRVVGTEGIVEVIRRAVSYTHLDHTASRVGNPQLLYKYPAKSFSRKAGIFNRYNRCGTGLYHPTYAFAASCRKFYQLWCLSLIHICVHPFNPVVLIPCTIYFWRNKKIKITGTSDSNDIANIAPQSVTEFGSANSFSATDTVYSFGAVSYTHLASGRNRFDRCYRCGGY